MRDSSRLTEREAQVWRLLERVPDPEIPFVSIVDLGIVRYVEWRDTEGPRVGLTPTYSGCPATAAIERAVGEALERAGFTEARIERVLSPPWSSDWLSAAAHAKLKAGGIAPPSGRAAHVDPDAGTAVACPRCGSRATRLVSEFGSTPCKAQHCCTECLEPFERFKCI